VPALVAAGIRPHSKVSELRGRGLVIPSPIDDNTEATVFTVETDAGRRVLLGLNNFYVITRYNRSVNYAMAVWELASELRTATRP
jgi:membrane-bound lytic murein transglycosylase B